MAWLLTTWSAQQDAGPPGAPLDPRFARLSGPGLVVFGLTMSLAADRLDDVGGPALVLDHLRLRDDRRARGWPRWRSSILTIFALMREAADGAASCRQKHLHDLGKLTFAFVMLYAYFTFSQFLIIWSANLPEEIPWYIRRFQRRVAVLVGGLVVGHFALPFAILLSAEHQAEPRAAVGVAALLFVMRMLDVLFQVAPLLPRDAHHPLDRRRRRSLGHGRASGSPRSSCS